MRIEVACRFERVRYTVDGGASVRLPTSHGWPLSRTWKPVYLSFATTSLEPVWMALVGAVLIFVGPSLQVVGMFIVAQQA